MSNLKASFSLALSLARTVRYSGPERGKSAWKVSSLSLSLCIRKSTADMLEKSAFSRIVSALAQWNFGGNGGGMKVNDGVAREGGGGGAAEEISQNTLQRLKARQHQLLLFFLLLQRQVARWRKGSYLILRFARGCFRQEALLKWSIKLG